MATVIEFEFEFLIEFDFEFSIEFEFGNGLNNHFKINNRHNMHF